jgi:hypothetical protein
MPGPTPGASLVGPAALTPHATAQAIPAIQAGVIAEAAALGRAAVAMAAVAMAAVEVIDNSRLRRRSVLIHRKGKSLDSFQFAFRSVWNHLKRGFFLLPQATIFHIDCAASPRGLPVLHDCLFLQRP